MKKTTLLSVSSIAVLALAIGLSTKLEGALSFERGQLADAIQPTYEAGSSAQPTIEPTATPTPKPTIKPTEKPIVKPTAKPTAKPTQKPVSKPSQKPIATPKPIKQTKPAVSDSHFLDLIAKYNLPANTVKIDAKGNAVVTNTSSIYVLVNKKRNLPSTYAPKDLTIANVPFSFAGSSPKKQMRKEAAGALESLFAAASKDGIKLKAVSGYRSYATQKAIFENNAEQKGEEVANRTSARPGQSEHQTGLAMDVSSANVGYALEESFGETKEGKWLAKHAAEHGFIIRFLKGKETITRYSYEPWHIRYVGKDAAKDITKKKLTLEEYFDAIVASKAE